MNGAAAAAGISERLKARCDKLLDSGVRPCLAILRVGARPDDLSYERAAMKRCAAIGVEVKNVVLPERVTEEAILAAVHRLNIDEAVHGVLMFRPLPRHLDERLICEALAPEKDMDGVSAASMAAVYSGSGTGYAPCTAQAVIELLKFYDIPIAGRRAVVAGRSLVIGRPVSMLLLRQDATVTLCHSRTADMPSVIREADIVVAAMGRLRAIGGELLRPGQAVVDVGVNMDQATGKLAGDVDYAAAERIVSAISPVPGGVGSVTACVLAGHVIEAAEKKQ